MIKVIERIIFSKPKMSRKFTEVAYIFIANSTIIVLARIVLGSYGTNDMRNVIYLTIGFFIGAVLMDFWPDKTSNHTKTNKGQN
jgi:hypothetical protein